MLSTLATGDKQPEKNSYQRIGQQKLCCYYMLTSHGLLVIQLLHIFHRLSQMKFRDCWKGGPFFQPRLMACADWTGESAGIHLIC